MSPELYRNPRPTPEVLDHERQLRALAAEENVPEGAISDRGYRFAATLLNIMRMEHGDRPYHNDVHGLNFARYFWALWKPLREELPERFDEEGFELGMIVGSGHDIINDPEAAKHNPGQNEQYSAEMVYGMMLETGYEETSAQRVYDAIIKTTVKRNDEGVIVQTYMREGPKDILGLCAGQADMNGILIKGPSVLFKDAIALYREYAPAQNALQHLRGAFSFLRDEDEYLSQRVAALSGDLEYYVEDQAEREIIRQVYWDEFRGASLGAVKAAKRLHDYPEQAIRLANSSAGLAKSIAYQGAKQIVAIKRRAAESFWHDDDS